MPHAYFFGYVRKSLVDLPIPGWFVIRGHTVYLDSGLIGGVGEFTVQQPSREAVVRPMCDLAEGVLVTCAIDEEGGALRLVCAMKPDVCAMKPEV